MLNPPISEQVTQVLHSFWALFGCDIRGTACISWTQNPGLRPPHPLDSSSSSAPRDCWWRPWRFHAPSLERTKSLIIAVISWWWDDDSWWWYWWFYNLIFYQPISLMFTVDASSWASLQKLWRDQYHMCWKYEYLKQPAMVDRSESSYNIYLTTRLVKMGKKGCFVSHADRKINCNQWSSRGSKLSQEGHALVPPKMTEVWDTKNSS